MSDYRLTLRLMGQKGLDPSWLVSALRSTYPKAEVVSIRPVASDLIDAVVRFRQAPAPAFTAGDTVAPLLQGIDWAPGLVSPSAVLESASSLEARSASSSTSEGEGIEAEDLGRLGLALLMIGTTAYLVHRRHKKKGGRPHHGHARPA